jgi:hypothetical protein
MKASQAAAEGGRKAIIDKAACSPNSPPRDQSRNLTLSNGSNPYFYS